MEGEDESGELRHTRKWLDPDGEIVQFRYPGRARLNSINGDKGLILPALFPPSLPLLFRQTGTRAPVWPAPEIRSRETTALTVESGCRGILNGE
jgi:hypothetical protein